MKVGLFIPCLVEQFYPEIGEASARVLARAGAEVIYPTRQTCCGQLLFKNGYRKQSRQLAKRFLSIFENSEAIVAPSGSCVSMVRKYYPELLRHEGGWYDRAVDLGSRVYELTEFLVNILGLHDVGARWNGKAVYHDSCQVSRVLGIKSEPRILLSAIRGLELIELAQPELCCGFGGAFSLQFPSISEAMVSEKASQILASRPQFVISAEIGCLMNIGGFLQKQGHPVRCIHIAEVLANSRKTP